jgi:hypothetical protein
MTEDDDKPQVGFEPENEIPMFRRLKLATSTSVFSIQLGLAPRHDFEPRSSV